MVTVLHLSDIHMGSGFAYGRLNPDTGMNTRLEDFVATLSCCIDRAIAEPADLVLFGGDAFPDATPPPLVQQAFAGQFRRLADAGIPTVLLVGNHDQHAQGQGGASLCIYRTLGVPGIVVGDRLATHRLTTASGPIQIVTLPWLTPSVLLTRPEMAGLSMAAVNEQLLERLRVALEGEIRRLDPDLPTILLAHLMTDTATFGAERFLAVGRGFNVPMALLTRPCFDYVALGHVHRHQILCESPPVVYPGSIERVDFSEAEEPKGYVWADVTKEQTTVEFCPLPVRAFVTIKVDLTDRNRPQAALLRAIAKYEVEDAVVRLIYSVRPDQMDEIDHAQLYDALVAAHTYTIHPQMMTPKSRSRLPELTPGQGLDPLAALQTYLENREDLAELAADMTAAAQALVADTPFEQPYEASPAMTEEPEDAAAKQLRLL
ncbi:MAG: exonuclease subunit SbcD [Leptolyngbyaceae cyanobacterium]